MLLALLVLLATLAGLAKGRSSRLSSGLRRALENPVGEGMVSMVVGDAKCILFWEGWGALDRLNAVDKDLEECVMFLVYEGLRF